MSFLWSYILGVASGITANQIYDYCKRNRKPHVSVYIDEDTTTIEGKFSNSNMPKDTLTFLGSSIQRNNP